MTISYPGCKIKHFSSASKDEPVVVMVTASVDSRPNSNNISFKVQSAHKELMKLTLNTNVVINEALPQGCIWIELHGLSDAQVISTLNTLKDKEVITESFYNVIIDDYPRAEKTDLSAYTLHRLHSLVSAMPISTTTPIVNHYKESMHRLFKPYMVKQKETQSNAMTLHAESDLGPK